MNTRTMEIIGEINGLKQLLTNSDYKALKYAEGELSEAEYAEVREYRSNLRAKINELEAELATVEA